MESGVYGARFRQVFGRGLERPTGRSDADAQSLGDEPPRGAGCPECSDLFSIHRGTWTPQLFPTDLARRSAARTRSCVNARSNSAMAPVMCIINRPLAVLRSRMLLGLRNAGVPTHVSECGDGVPQRPAELADLGVAGHPMLRSRMLLGLSTPSQR